MRRLFYNQTRRTFELFEFPEIDGKLVEGGTGDLICSCSEEFIIQAMQPDIVKSHRKKKVVS